MKNELVKRLNERFLSAKIGVSRFDKERCIIILDENYKYEFTSNGEFHEVLFYKKKGDYTLAYGREVSSDRFEDILDEIEKVRQDYIEDIYKPWRDLIKTITDIPQIKHIRYNDLDNIFIDEEDYRPLEIFIHKEHLSRLFIYYISSDEIGIKYADSIDEFDEDSDFIWRGKYSEVVDEVHKIMEGNIC